MFRPITEHVKL